MGMYMFLKQVADVARQVETTKKQLPDAKGHAATIARLQEDLASEKALTERWVGRSAGGAKEQHR